MSRHYIAHSVTEAWEIADRIFPSDYCYNGVQSERVGYPVYESTIGTYPEYLNHINDLCVRLEVCIGMECINIWIEDETPYEKALRLIRESTDMRLA